MIKIIASDLDETLLGHTRSVSEKNRKAILAAAGAGVKFVPATGRGYRTVGKTLAEIGLLDKPEEYVISFNGAAITENAGSRLLKFDGLPFARVNELFRRGQEYGFCMHIYTRDTVYVYRYDDEDRAYVTGRMEVVEMKEDSIDFLKDEPLAKILYARADMDYLRKVREEVRDISDGLDVSFSSGRYLEFNRGGVNKGAGLLWLADYLGVAREETMALGDSTNDLTMLEAAGIGVGVANASEDVRAVCDVITDHTCEEDAVAEAIERFVL